VLAVSPVTVFVGDHQLSRCDALKVGHEVKPLAAVVQHCCAAQSQRVFVQRQVFGFERHRCIPVYQKLQVGEGGVAHSHDSRRCRFGHQMARTKP
jgi:hypothetical protein